ncbi:fatty acid cis/trans isomerase [Moritella sp. JT01]|uniref:fatty acid cis/trans isomerase n=1 Tax=Moritella sp. JT01 TaxID=756698 RepID=UPI0012F8BD68|nr:fatty acid cis/trans isomerase [Moritella sp. JT01]
MASVLYAGVDDYGVRRSVPRFWSHTEVNQTQNQLLKPFNTSLLDYKRLQNR